MYLSREEIDALSHQMSIKGRSKRAVVHLLRDPDGALFYRHANGAIWYVINTEFTPYASGGSAPKVVAHGA